jgi:hypothetical protein
MLPLADICFTFEFIMGKDATPLSLYDIIGLVLILAGTFIALFGHNIHLTRQSCRSHFVPFLARVQAAKQRRY